MCVDRRLIYPLVSSKLLLFFVSMHSVGQDVDFSQPLQSSLHTNPAMAGATSGPRFALAYRNQWAGLGQAYLSIYAAADGFAESLSGSWGIFVLSDRQGQGLFLRNSLAGIYAYRLEVSQKAALQIALQASAEQRSINTAQLIFAENINPLDGSMQTYGSVDLPERDHRLFADFGSGLLLFTSHFFAGFALQHVTTPNESFYSNTTVPLPLRWSSQLGFRLASKQAYQTRVTFVPYLVYSAQGRFHVLQTSASLSIGSLIGGLAYRHTLRNPDAVIFMAGLRHSIMSIAYSFDATVSPLKGGAGSHELTLSINLSDSEKLRAHRNRRLQTRCPGLY